MAAPSIVGIWNRALQLLGAQRVQATSDTSKNALACLTCYQPILYKLLESHPWRFAIKLASLAADSPVPDWGKANSFTLPTDYLAFAPDYDEDLTLDKDWEFQDGKIYTDDTAPIYLRYIASVSDPLKMTATFRELLSTAMALAMCEEITQSNTKKVNLETAVERAAAIARRANSRQVRAQQPPQDDWITIRA